jgi:L-threonylcarbamoyladenylate synthase
MNGGREASSPPTGTLAAQDADRLADCLASEGVCVFPADTVYGLGCDPDSQTAVQRLYELKRRPAEKPAAVMFFAVRWATQALPELTERERTVLHALLPGALTLLLANRTGRFERACGPDPTTLGLRVPALPARLQALSAIARPVMQSSANLAGEPEARRLQDVPEEIRDGADLVLDGGELPGVASTVVDLRDYERLRRWSIVREGPVTSREVELILASC